MPQSSNRKPSTNAQQTDDRASRSQASLEPPAQDVDLIARAAYQRYEARGREDGHDVEDWLTAEREMRGSDR
jgi:hypothetical protein